MVAYSRLQGALVFSRMISAGTAERVRGFQRSLRAASEVCREAIASVSPRQLVARSVSVAESEAGAHVMRVGGREYSLNHNVKVVAFGKAVLGMLEALQGLLGEHIVSGVASVPVGSVGVESSMRGNVRIMEGAAHNLPDRAALSAARDILALCQEAGQHEVVVALMSGGGSALLPCPIQGVELECKRKMIELLSKAGADIKELNVFRKYFSQTKGGRLAEAAHPAQMVGLIVSDVIGDPLDTIASGPTTPTTTTHHDIIALLEKFSLTHSFPQSMQHILFHKNNSVYVASPPKCVEIENGHYKHVENVIIGSNRDATEAVMLKAKALGYTSVAWSNSVQGEARLVGEVYAALAHSVAEFGLKSAVKQLRMMQCFANLCKVNPAMLGDFEQLEQALLLIAETVGNPCDLCLVSGGEPTVTVTGDGNGGRNQELALSFSLKHQELKAQLDSESVTECVLMSLGTDGQDGPTDAAGAIGHSSITPTASLQGLDAECFLRQNDSHSFFSRLEGGKYLLKTGLTGTNVMDIHCLLFTNVTKQCD